MYGRKCGVNSRHRLQFLLMTLNLKFAQSDFESLRSFERAVAKQLGNNVYVGTDSLCLYFDFPPALKAMIRPFPKDVQLEFELVSSRPEIGQPNKPAKPNKSPAVEVLPTVEAH